MTKYSRNYLKDFETLKWNETNFNLYSNLLFYFTIFSLFNQNNLKKRFFVNYDNEKYFELRHCEININNILRYSIFIH
jgi:hypothetical protein